MSLITAQDTRDNVLLTTVSEFFAWARSNSPWPLQFGIACCAIEMMATGASRFDIARFGAEAFRASPRQADIMIVAGTVTFKMGEVIRRLFAQMAEPRYVISMGGCATGGGPYFKYGYHVMKGVDKIIPVDVYVPGCPPTPEQLLCGLMKLQEIIRQRKDPREMPTLDPQAFLSKFPHRGQNAFPPGGPTGLPAACAPWRVAGDLVEAPHVA